MARDLATEVERMLESIEDEIPALKQAARKLWSAMTEDEKLSLWKEPRTFSIIDLGGQVEDLELLEEAEAPRALRAEITEIDFWFRSAEGHAENAGEWEHEVGDLEDLVQVCAETMEPERVVAAMTADGDPQP